MLKNLKLGARTVGGFAIVLILLAVVAYIGYNGMSGVVDRVDKADDVNRLIKTTLQSRQQEKNFIIRGEKEYVDKVQKDVADLKAQANVTKDKFKDPANKRQMDDVLAAVGKYEKGFGDYVGLHAKEKATEEKMFEAARSLQAMANTIREEQKKELAQVKAESNAHIEDKMTKADDANRIIKWALESRRQEKNYIIRGDRKYVEEVDNRVDEIVTLSKDMKSRFNQAHNKEQADHIIAFAKAYKAAFDEYVLNKEKAAEDKMLQAARGLISMADTIREEQKKELAQVKGESNGHIEDKMAKADDANRIIKWSLGSRQQEKNFMMRGDKKYADLVDKNVEHIIVLAEDMKSRFKQAKNKEQADHIIASAQAYKAAFDEVVVLSERQDEADSAMVAAARATQEVCDKARADQKAKMEAQIGTATKTMFGGAIVAILLGLGFAFMISKSISGGIGKVVNNIKQIAEDATNGKLDSRANVEAVGVDFKAIPAGFNNTLDALIAPLNVMAEYVDRVSKGDIPESITDEYKGDFNEVKNNLNQLIDAINGLVAEAGMMREAAVEGKLDTRGDAAKFGGDFAKIVQGVNETLDAVIGPLNVAAEYVDRISKGDIPESITDEYKGDFNEVKNNLNQAIDALKGLIEEDGGVVLEAAANRDLTVNLKREYQGGYAKMKDNINRMIESMHEALGQAAIAADQVGAASGQVAGSSQQLAEGSAEQASSLEETSSSLEEMSSMTKQNADNANQANTLMEEANQVIGRANNSMGELTTSMDEINKASEETSKIIKTIDEIAFQTNLLALNAAVEAARAGEAGAGFAVVADEVRNLAMRAADAAKNTSVMIEDTVKKVGGGAEIVTKTNEAFTEVATSASKVAELVGEIAAASQEQTQGIEQVNKAVAEMDKVTQANAANAEESASASEEMSAQAQELQSMLAEFKLNQSGRKQIAKAAPKQQVKKIDHTQKPEAVIPMGDDDKTEDDDFKDF